MDGGAWWATVLVGSRRVGHDWATSLSLFTFMYWRRKWQPTPVFLPGKSHGRRSLVGCSSWCRKELGTTEWLYFHFSLSCIGEGNGNPPQCSCLEDLRDGEPGGVAQSQTQLKQLSSSSNSYSGLDGVTCFDQKDHSRCDRSWLESPWAFPPLLLLGLLWLQHVCTPELAL